MARVTIKCRSFLADGRSTDGLTPEERSAFSRRAVQRIGQAIEDRYVNMNADRNNIPRALCETF